MSKILEEMIKRIIDDKEEFTVWANGIQIGHTLYKVNQDKFWDLLHRELELRGLELRHISNTYWVE